MQAIILCGGFATRLGDATPIQIGLTLAFQSSWRMPDNTSKMETFNESGHL